ncbi:MAG: putative lipoprotein [Gammaproteobacteria bacterium]|nr:putative lipoprotein [Gammaproteobacteria bacterium]
MTISSALRVHRRWSGVAVLALAVAACATLQVGSDYDKSANFAGYHTFVLMQRQHQDTQNPLVASRAQDAIKAELTRKGYVPAADPAAADFAVDFTIGSRERTDISSYPAPYAGPWGGAWWGGPYWGDNVDVRQYREGTLSIDIFDVRTHRPVWHGWAKKELTRKDIEQSEEPIRRAVAAVLKNFPPNSATAEPTG